MTLSKGDLASPEEEEEQETWYGCYLWVGILIFCLLVFIGILGLAWMALEWLVGMLPHAAHAVWVVCGVLK